VGCAVRGLAGVGRGPPLGVLVGPVGRGTDGVFMRSLSARPAAFLVGG
jgi:hypothetical protein